MAVVPTLGLIEGNVDVDVVLVFPIGALVFDWDGDTVSIVGYIISNLEGDAVIGAFDGDWDGDIIGNCDKVMVGCTVGIEIISSVIAIYTTNRIL